MGESAYTRLFHLEQPEEIHVFSERTVEGNEFSYPL